MHLHGASVHIRHKSWFFWPPHLQKHDPPALFKHDEPDFNLEGYKSHRSKNKNDGAKDDGGDG